MLRNAFWILAGITLMGPGAVDAYDREPISVFVSIAPQKYFVQQIGKSLVDVQTMVQPGASPHNYEPKPRQMAALAKSRAYFAIGVHFESVWLQKISAVNPEMKIVHTEEGIAKYPVAAGFRHDDGGPDEEHGDRARPGAAAADHAGGGLDPHIWLSPPLVKQQAYRIMAALVELDPQHEDAYTANYRQLVASIDQLDNEIKAVVAGKDGMPFVVFHPAWGYFARAYGLKQIPIEVEGKSPKPAQLAALIAFARRNQIRVVFAQPQFSAKSAALIAGEIGGRVVFADPLAEDWAANLRTVTETFRTAWR